LVGLTAVRPRRIYDNLDDLFLLADRRVKLEINGHEALKEQVAGVGDDGSAARGDAVAGDQEEEVGEDAIDVQGGFEFGELADEFGGEVARACGGRLEVGVFVAEIGRDVVEGEATTAAAGVAMETARQTARSNGLS
jgi:hypothetical protein